MINYREILRQHSMSLNNTQISESTGISRPTIIKVIRRADEINLDWQEAKNLTDIQLAVKLFPEENEKPVYRMPDYINVHKEMAKSNVTLQLLWYEYRDKCHQSGEIPYQLTQFKKYYRDFVIQTKATMHIEHKPGEIMETDWAGTPAIIKDTDTGADIKTNIFVCVLPYSGYAYVEAFLTRDEYSWITAHVHAYKYFGGTTRILVCDNLKTGVIKNTKTETVFNRSYLEMAEHYGTAIIPARVRRAKDKASVEGAVGIVSTSILAAIRNDQFLSIDELNEVLADKLETYNHKPFQKKDGSRAILFEEERLFLNPLPANSFEAAIWKTATVSFNYHISVDKQNYSIPYEYIKREVDVRITQSTIEVFFNEARICSHKRLYGRSYQYSTMPEHMPPAHQKYLYWDSDHFRGWASNLGPNTMEVVNSILKARKIEQQGFKACRALIELADKYSFDRVEAACAKALSYTAQPSYKQVQTILKTGQDKTTGTSNEPPECKASGHSFTRGSEYYGRRPQ
jgi:transposase